MAGILRLSHAEVRVPDLELALAYYAEVVGLVEVERDGRARLPQGLGRAPAPLLILLTGADLRARRAGLQGRASSTTSTGWRRESRRPASRHRGHAPGELGPGSGQTVRFRAPSGHVVELEHGMDQVGNGMPQLNPPIGPDGLVGMHPPRIDHVFLMCEDVNGVTDFFRDVLDFRMTEQILADDGYQLATFLERSHSTHDIAFLTGPDGGFHHVAFWVDDWNELRNAADICAYHGMHVDAGPTRHGATRGCGLYFFDPAGNRNELYTGGYWFDPDDEPTTWTETEIGRAIFYYQGESTRPS